MLACGNCVYYAMWNRFPPTASWVVIIPLWFLVLSGMRTFGAGRLKSIPPLYVAGPLVFLVFLFAPGAVGPPLGFWIPICCVVGTASALSGKQSPGLRKSVLLLTAGVVAALIIFGVHDYVVYNQMPSEEKAKFQPVWEANWQQGESKGTRIVFKVDADDSASERDELLQSVRRVIDQRLQHVEHLPNCLVQVSGDDRIEVLTPEVTADQLEQIRQLATRPGTLQFALLANRFEHAARIDAATSGTESASPDGSWEWVPVAAGVDDPGSQEGVVFRDVEAGGTLHRQYLIVRGPTEQRVTGAGMRRAAEGTGPRGVPVLDFQLSDEGSRRMLALTTAAAPKPGAAYRNRMAIILDGEIHSAPMLNEAIGGRGQITGLKDREEIHQLAAVLSAGALPAPVEFIHSEARGGGVD